MTAEDRTKAQERYDTVRSNYSPVSETGETAKNIGAMFDNLTPIIGPLGLLGQGVAGLFEIGTLDDVLSSMDLQELDWGDIAKAAFTGATLRSETDDNIYDALEKDGGRKIEQSSWYNNAPKGWDTDAKGRTWEYTASDTLDSLYGNRNPLESLEIPFDFKNMTTPEFVEWDNQKQKEKIAKNERGLFSNISPAFQVTPEQFRSPEGYDTRLNTITTIDQAHQYWNTKALIEAEEEARLGDTFEWSAGDGSLGSNESSGSDTDQGGNQGYGNDGGGQDDYD
jgi:hypothetical protein